jgi:haloalkane dehalogenase
MPVLRTPDDRFVGLPDYDFSPHYCQVAGPGESLRMHYVDEGPADASPVLLLHGEPTWSYLYRKMIPVFAAAGYRAIAPDHIGFGRSDKLADIGDYTYERHIGWIRELVETLDLRGITLVCQDWGGPIGLSVLAADEHRFARVVAANTILPTARPLPAGEVAGWPGETIEAWMEMARSAPELPVGDIIQSVTTTNLSKEVVAAYDAPFPDESYKAGARAFPAIIPTTAGDPGALRNRGVWEVLRRFEKPFLTAFSDSDPTTAPWSRVFLERVPGAAKRSHPTIANAGHFLQEDRGEELARVVLELMNE